MRSILPRFTVAALLFASSDLTSAQTVANADPIVPVGALSAFPTIVQTGTHPTLTWSIMHPTKVFGSSTGGGNSGADTAAIVNPPGELIPAQDIFITVQIIGTGVTACQNGQATPPPTDLRISVNGGPYEQLFFGTQAAVNSSQRLFIKKIRSGQRINLGGRYVIGTGWSPFYTTRSSNLQVVSLVKGDNLPTGPNFQKSNMASFLKPYFDSSNKVSIGPMSVLVLMELGQKNRNMPCFDYQDQAVLVTFSRNHPNNGHGNNLDGVDSSNPGQGQGGPNGAVDPSGGYDDEAR